VFNVVPLIQHFNLQAAQATSSSKQRHVLEEAGWLCLFGNPVVRAPAQLGAEALLAMYRATAEGMGTLCSAALLLRKDSPTEDLSSFTGVGIY